MKSFANRTVSIVAMLAISATLSACSTNEVEMENPTPSDSSTRTQETPNTTAETEASIVESEPAFADDAVVDNCIASYNATCQSPIESVERGNIRTKYFAYSYGYYLELLNANDTGKINVSISQTNDNADSGVAGMREVFHDVVKACDPSLSDEAIYNHFDALISADVIAEGSALGSTTVTFIPDRNLSGGHSRGHIEIAAH